MRVLKKYPNRRLYDTQESCYVTLDDVKTLVLKHENFQIVDSKSGNDITRSILMQIISEQETTDSSLFSNKMLQQLIRFYGDSLQGVMGEYLEKSIARFMEQQDILRHQLHHIVHTNPLKQISDFAERNIPVIKSIKGKTRQKKAPATSHNKKTKKHKKP